MSVSLSARGRRKHRHPDGSAKSAIALKHDRCFENVAGIRRPLLRKEGLCARDIEARLSREWHEHERIKAVQSLDEQRRAPCTHSLTSGVPVAKQSAPESAGPSASAAASPAADASDLGALCRICNSHKCSTSGALEMILCDACDQGNHRGCIDNLGKYAPGKNDRWLCTGCRRAGTRIEIWDRAAIPACGH